MTPTMMTTTAAPARMLSRLLLQCQQQQRLHFLCTSGSRNFSSHHCVWRVPSFFEKPLVTAGAMTTTCQTFSSSSSDNIHNNRVYGIQMNPKSVGQHILPGDVVVRKNLKTGKERKIFTDRAYGYFWMLKDLEETGSKPVLSNEALIPAEQATVFPTLDNLETLEGESVDLPRFLLRNNRTKDAASQCTLVAISFRDYGYKLLPSWIEPFEKFLDSGRFEVVRVSVVEGWFLKTLLKPILKRQAKKNTPVELHGTSLLKFGNVGNFVDSLRMHNTMTGYVYLLDGLGRVRFAGSGKASMEEAEQLIEFARELVVVPQQQQANKQKKKKPSRGKNFRQS